MKRNYFAQTHNLKKHQSKYFETWNEAVSFVELLGGGVVKQKGKDVKYIQVVYETVLAKAAPALLAAGKRIIERTPC